MEAVIDESVASEALHEIGPATYKVQGCPSRYIRVSVSSAAGGGGQWERAWAPRPGVRGGRLRWPRRPIDRADRILCTPGSQTLGLGCGRPTTVTSRSTPYRDIRAARRRQRAVKVRAATRSRRARNRIRPRLDRGRPVLPGLRDLTLVCTSPLARRAVRIGTCRVDADMDGES